MATVTINKTGAQINEALDAVATQGTKIASLEDLAIKKNMLGAGLSYNELTNTINAIIELDEDTKQAIIDNLGTDIASSADVDKIKTVLEIKEFETVYDLTGQPSTTLDGNTLNSTGGIMANATGYSMRVYDISSIDTLRVKGHFRGSYNLYIYGFYNSSTINASNLISGLTVGEFADITSGAKPVDIDSVLTKPTGATHFVCCSYPENESGYMLMYPPRKIAYVGQNVIDKILSMLNMSEDGKIYVDAIGDSLTMGHSNFGFWLSTLAELLGDKYKVRNWGVGGENIASIMVRQGSASTIFPTKFTLPANQSEVEIANGANASYLKSAYNNQDVTLLMQGAGNDPEHRERVVNPCFINNIECTMTRYIIDSSVSSNLKSNIRWTIKRNQNGDRDIVIPAKQQLILNTGKQMQKADITILWMGANRGYIDIDDLVEAHRIAVRSIPNNKYIIIGLHTTLTNINAELYESAMIKEFGNKFFNIREYACSNMIYDAGITPTAEDISNMESGVCPASLLYDTVHFKPSSSIIIANRVFDLITNLGYV